MMNRFGEHGWGMGFGMGLWWIVGIILIVIIVWVVIKMTSQTNHSNNQQGNKSALDILKERYARGEIDKKEFEERRKDLM